MAWIEEERKREAADNEFRAKRALVIFNEQVRKVEEEEQGARQRVMQRLWDYLVDVELERASAVLIQHGMAKRPTTTKDAD